jgi:hypothetical protein
MHRMTTNNILIFILVVVVVTYSLSPVLLFFESQKVSQKSSSHDSPKDSKSKHVRKKSDFITILLFVSAENQIKINNICIHTNDVDSGAGWTAARADGVGERVRRLCRARSLARHVGTLAACASYASCMFGFLSFELVTQFVSFFFCMFVQSIIVLWMSIQSIINLACLSPINHSGSSSRCAGVCSEAAQRARLLLSDDNSYVHPRHRLVVLRRHRVCLFVWLFCFAYLLSSFVDCRLTS